MSDYIKERDWSYPMPALDLKIVVNIVLQYKYPGPWGLKVPELQPFNPREGGWSA